MSEAHVRAELERVAEEAAGWFVRLRDEAATGDDWLAFAAWPSAAPANAEAYDHLERLWVDRDEAHAEIRRDLETPSAIAAPPARRVRELGRRRLSPSRRTWIAGG